jgi:hypothetical protein
MANALIKQVEQMTYRQLCLLSMFAQRDKFSEFPLYLSFNATSDKGAAYLSFFADIYALSQQGILDIAVRMDEIHPQLNSIRTLGLLLFDLMELGNIDSSELEKLAEQLGYSRA